MSYFDTLTSEQRSNVNNIVAEARSTGITNPYAISALLSIVSKETEFIPKSENLNYTTAERISKVFGLSSSEAKNYVSNPEKLANRVYGGKYGNTASGDGWKYRGRGYNQLTFKDNYKAYQSLIGEDIVSNPDKVNDPKVASKVLMQYFKRNIQRLKDQGKLASYNASDINDFKNLDDATLAFYHANAGPGKSVQEIKALVQNDPYGGMTKALKRVGELYEKAVKTTVELVKKNPITTIVLVSALVVAGWIFFKYTGLKDKIKNI